MRGIATVRCSECSKPRIVYRADGVSAGGRKETSLDRKLFNVLSEQGLYACGKTVQDMVNSVRTRDHVANMMEKIGMQEDSSENAAAWIGLVARVTKSYVVGAWVCIQGMEKNYWIAQRPRTQGRRQEHLHHLWAPARPGIAPNEGGRDSQ